LKIPEWISYRGFIIEAVKREFRMKYQNSLFGMAWNVINPLAMIVVYTVIFAGLMRAKLPGIDSKYAYSIYLCAGTLTWGFFVEIISKEQTIFIENANLLKKINFPHGALLAIVIINALLNFSIVAFLFITFLLLTDNFPGWVILAAIPILLLQTIFAIGLGLILGVLNVFFRDVGQFFAIFLQFWFWLTPIVYPADILPKVLRPYLAFNPMSPVIIAYQAIFVNHQLPAWETLWPIMSLGLVLCWLGLRLFKKHASEIVDEL